MTRAETALATPARAFRPLRASPVVALLVAYAVSRVLTTSIMAVVYWFAARSLPTFGGYDGAPDPAGFLESWDGLHYGSIAESGYPSDLPVDGFGRVEKNTWAFLPVFPLVTRVVMELTGAEFAVAGTGVATVFGGAATVMLYRMLLPQVGQVAAFWAAVLFCFGPLSFVLQIAYAESVFLFFMFATLTAMIRRRYLLMIPLGVIAAFSHPGALAIPAALGVHWLIRAFGDEPFPLRARVESVIAGLVLAAAGFAWPLVATTVTGEEDAYFDTEMAWWREYIGPVDFAPFTPWFTMGASYLGAAGIALVVALMVGAFWLMSRPRLRVLGLDVLLYAGSYLAYLFAVFLPQQSLFRMLMPLAPLLAAPALTATRARRVLALTAGIALQPVAIMLLWAVFPP